jgi:glycosyltransferase involved in cell wall biosynthesis
MRVLHITDAYAAGVMTSINQLAITQNLLGHNVEIAFLVRESTILDPHVLPASIKITSFGNSTVINLLRFSRELMNYCKDFDIIHLHSSKMGFIGRIIFRFSGNESHLIYSPHGYSFLRRDVSCLSRAFFWVIEALLGRFFECRIACVGQHEFELTLRFAQKRAFLLRNILVQPDKFEFNDTSQRYSPNGNLCISYMARNAPQKDPKFFLEVVKSLSSNVDFVWIGATLEDCNEFMDSEFDFKNLNFAGVLSHSSALKVLIESDLMIVTSLWEGLPMNIIEAQALGIPVLLRDTISVPDLIRHNHTGFVFTNISEIEELLNSKDFDKLSSQVRINARMQYEMNFSQDALIRELNSNYFNIGL